jgi:hypothetical protein
MVPLKAMTHFGAFILFPLFRTERMHPPLATLAPFNRRTNCVERLFEPNATGAARFDNGAFCFGR